MGADRVGDLYYLREDKEQANAATTQEMRGSDASLWHARLGHLHMDANAIPIDIDYAHPDEENPEPGRVTRNEPGRVARNEQQHEEDQMEPPARRARGRPAKAKTGKPGRPKRMY
ncbi:Protein of unknown function [Cotesia congregata]|uniref:GAG-pre-integrase domain-containing protein n=1 Tax=Cotesia congregata TaxID=51543 RepID=A0A8J2EFP8_COTCN|nr:Protein of unknown function [Cotesia congregata]